MPDNYVIQVSKKGDSVLGTDPKNLRLNSDDMYLKIFEMDDTSFTTNGSGNASIAIPHGLDYAPGHFVMRKATAKWNPPFGSSLFPSTEYTDAFFPVGQPNFYIKDDQLHHCIHAWTDVDYLHIEARGAKPSTLMNFRYIILVDRAQAFTGDSIDPGSDYVLETTPPGVSVTTAKQYEKGFSTFYKIVQYFTGSRKKETLTLPEMFADFFNDDVSEGTYVDFTHGLGFPPLPLVHSQVTGNAYLTEAPDMYLDSIDIFSDHVGYFVDGTRIRVYWWRHSGFFLGAPTAVYPQNTVTARVTPLLVNLSGAPFSV